MHTVAFLAVSHKASRHSSFCLPSYVSPVNNSERHQSWCLLGLSVLLALWLFVSLDCLLVSPWSLTLEFHLCPFSCSLSLGWISSLLRVLLFWFWFGWQSALQKLAQDAYFEWCVKRLAEFCFFRVSFWCFVIVVLSCFPDCSRFWWSAQEPEHYKRRVPLLVFKD